MVWYGLMVLTMERRQVDKIRETARTELLDNRRAHRDEEADCRRNMIVTQNVTQDYVADIANRLKSKPAVTVTEICLLKNALLDHPDYVNVVLNTQGALRGLVRELTGQDAKRQLAAAGCLCNAGRGGETERTCMTLVKSAGPYLVAALDSLNTELAITCAWTLANTAGSGPKAAALVTSQGAVSRLACLLTSPTDDVRDAAALALVQITRRLADDLKKEHASLIFQALSNGKLTNSSFQLLFVLSCHNDFNQLINEAFLQNVLEVATSRMTILTHANGSEFVYTIRTLANIDLNDSIYNGFVEHFSLKLDLLKNVIKMNIGPVNEALVWFLGNLYNYSSENEFFNHLCS